MKAWRGCCYHRESGTQGLCVHSLDQMEKGHNVILKFQQFQGGVSILGTLEANWAHSAAQLCAGRGFWESDGLYSSWKLRLSESPSKQRCFHSQYPADRSLTPLSLSFTFLLLCGNQVKWCGLVTVSLTYPTRASSTGYYHEQKIILNLTSKPHIKKDKLLLEP